MARLLIRAITNGSDPAHWQRGHVVYVAEDGHEFGRLEGPPRFYVLDVPGAPGDYAHLLEPPEISTALETEPRYGPRPKRAVDVDAPLPPDPASARVPALARNLLRTPMGARMEHGPVAARAEGLPIKRID